MALLQGKTAVITGGSTGIGLATVKRFVEEGAYVFINGRSQAELDAAIEEIGGNVIGVQGDGSKPGDRDRLYAAVADTGRRLDVVFANAAAIDVARIGDVTQEHLQRALPLLNDGGSIILNSANTNQYTCWHCCSGPLRHGRGGRERGGFAGCGPVARTLGPACSFRQ